MNLPNIKELLDLLVLKRYQIFRQVMGKPLNLNILGLRDILGEPDTFADWVVVMWEEGTAWKANYYPATTLPGRPYLLSPVDKDGAAILVPGQYLGAYQVGLHRGKYEALVQTGSEVSVYRDNDHDVLPGNNHTFMESGFFGINVHRASALSRVVGVNSAGCQVIKSRTHFDEFMSLCKAARAVWGNKFTYTLVEI